MLSYPRNQHNRPKLDPVVHVARRSTIALATAGALASTGSAYLGARNLLVGQAIHVRTLIPKSWETPPRADGVYTRGGGPVERWRGGAPFDLHLMIFGDSTATGYGCVSPDEVPGALIARSLAEQTGLRIRLSTKAIVGATSKGVYGQVDAMFVAGPPPDVAVIIIGANDITALNGVGPSAARLGASVRKLRNRGAVVVVGTCPDFGMITAIPQPLRSLARTRGLQLARAQAAAVRAAGGAAGATGASAGSQVPRDARADVLRRPLPPLGGRVCRSGRTVAACAARGAERKARHSAAGTSGQRARDQRRSHPTHPRVEAVAPPVGNAYAGRAAVT